MHSSSCVPPSTSFDSILASPTRQGRRVLRGVTSVTDWRQSAHTRAAQHPCRRQPCAEHPHPFTAEIARGDGAVGRPASSVFDHGDRLPAHTAASGIRPETGAAYAARDG
ncbi:hypothetical protein RSPO_c01305 [Ralstonia solanacearum Po82]|uniref:Uncharacterized protein n=1 Tax=Ralstonia solanacearum (strain Po82) TaxID=1031711 RepID=F6G021_RALS8|nr:hypothetical protein RSPO_c01305 [Ralstonia solanacearum Po82]